MIVLRPLLVQLGAWFAARTLALALIGGILAAGLAGVAVWRSNVKAEGRAEERAAVDAMTDAINAELRRRGEEINERTTVDVIVRDLRSGGGVFLFGGSRSEGATGSERCIRFADGAVSDCGLSGTRR